MAGSAPLTESELEEHIDPLDLEEIFDKFTPAASSSGASFPITNELPVPKRDLSMSDVVDSLSPADLSDFEFQMESALKSDDACREFFQQQHPELGLSLLKYGIVNYMWNDEKTRMHDKVETAFKEAVIDANKREKKARIEAKSNHVSAVIRERP